MNTKHSPGPWGIEDNGHEMRKEMIVSRARGNTCIALTFALVGDEERKANARLIASSPELLEALQRAVEQFDYTVKSMTLGHTVSISSLQNCSAMARQAILKATGGKE